jgi:hypothetical protein
MPRVALARLFFVIEPVAAAEKTSKSGLGRLLGA